MDMETTYKIAAINDEFETCSCCGKTNLKKTAQLVDDAGNVKILGTTCMTKFLGAKVAKAQTKVAAALTCPNLSAYVAQRNAAGKSAESTKAMIKATVPGATDAQIAAVYGV